MDATDEDYEGVVSSVNIIQYYTTMLYNTIICLNYRVTAHPAWQRQAYPIGCNPTRSEEFWNPSYYVYFFVVRSFVRSLVSRPTLCQACRLKEVNFSSISSVYIIIVKELNKKNI